MKRKYKIVDCTTDPTYVIANGDSLSIGMDGQTLIHADQRLIAVIPKTMAVIEIVEPE